MKPFFSPIEIENTVSDILKRHGMEAPPVDPIAIANGEGIAVYLVPPQTETFSGAIYRKGSDVEIYANGQESSVRQRFTIAHELGHYFLHADSEGFVDTDANMLMREVVQIESEERRRIEVQANMFAAELLMPRQMLSRALEETTDLQELSAVFMVSQPAMGFRISNLSND